MGLAVEEMVHPSPEHASYHSLHINKLPIELLIQIFLEFWNVTEGPTWTLRSRAGRTGSLLMGWWGLMLVCRRWRDVLVSTPAFWRKIRIKMDGPNDWTELCLALSASASIDVFADPDLRLQFSLDILYPHVHRFRSFRFCTVYCPRLFATLPHLFGNGMPLLEDFHFVAHRLVVEMEDIDLRLTSRRFPRLQALWLSGIASPQDISLYAQLRRLSLSGCSHNLSFDRFLDALAASAQLEELCLAAALYRFPDDWIRNGTCRAPIPFPRLRKLRLEEHGIVRTSSFLAHLRLHPSVTLWIEGAFKELDYVDDSPDIVNTITAMLPPDLSSILPILSLATAVRMTISGDEYEISGENPRIEPKKDISNATFMLGSRDGRGWDHFMTQGLDDLINSFGRSPLTCLNVYGDHQHGAADAWSRVFRTFPLLQVLDISGEPDGSVETVFLGLHAASQSAATQTDTSSSVACPSLKTVAVECKGTVETYTAILDCFRYRAEKGVVLDTLNLGFALHAEDVPPDARRAYVKDLREAVHRVFRWVRSGSGLIFASESEDSESEMEDRESGSDELESDREH